MTDLKKKTPIAGSIFGLIIFFVNIQGSHLPQLNNLVECGNFKELKLMLDNYNLSIGDQDALLKYAYRVSLKHERTGLLSRDSKKSLLAVLALASFGLSFFVLNKAAYIFMVYDQDPHIKTSFMRCVAALESRTKRHYALLFLAAGVCLGISALSCWECDIGYYTDRYQYIFNFLYKRFNIKSVATMGDSIVFYR